MRFLDRVDPAYHEVLAASPPLDLSRDIPRVRELNREARTELLAAAPEVPEVKSRDVLVPGFEGDPDVLVRVYEPVAGHNGAALSYIHGGGMVLMGIEDSDFQCRRITKNIGCLVTSVEYRLAPEHPYPAGIHDCYAALTWLHAEAGALRLDPARIGIGGSSAGGGLAAGTALLAKDRGEVNLCFQWLVYPMLDDRNDLPSTHEVTYPGVWNRASNRYAWKAYLAGVGDEVPVYAAPGRAAVEALVGLPPAYLDVGDMDLFRDENIQYASRLLAAGVPTELHVIPGAFHACENMVPAAETSRRIARLRNQALARFLG